MFKINKPEEKFLYKIHAQTDSISITATTDIEMTAAEAAESAVKDVLSENSKYHSFVALPITTQERWENGSINYCPRCGTNISEYGLHENARTDCQECDASLDINIEI